MAEMEVDEVIGTLTDPMTNPLLSKARVDELKQKKEKGAKLPTHIGKMGRIKSEMAVQVGETDYNP